MTGFNLVSEPWISCEMHDGHTRDLSLRGVFDRAHEVRHVVGEIPTQSVAILRMLLAVVLHTWEIDVSDPEGALDAWEERWRTKSLPLDVVQDYLARHAHRFDLLSQDQPFMQVTGLRTTTGKMSGLPKLIAEVPDGFQFFTTRSGESIARITHAEAARWLVHCHAFDPSGIKSGAVGDPHVKGGKGYPIGTGWAGSLGLVVLQGPTLVETLLLNCDLSSKVPGDVPSWEVALTPDRTSWPSMPRGPVGAFTWPTRRIVLVHDADGVTDALVCNGTPAETMNAMAQETMTGWRSVDPRQGRPGGYAPKGHMSGRAVWRGFESTLASSAQGNPGAPPRILQWLAELRRWDVLGTEPIMFRAIAMHYGTQNSTVVGVSDDAVSLPPRVITDERMRGCAVGAVHDAYVGCRAVGAFAADLRVAAGGDSEGAAARGQERAYARVDAPYRSWVAALGESDHPDDARVAWRRTLRTILSDLADELGREAGKPAVIGRQIPVRGQEGREHLLDSAKARSHLNATLARDLPVPRADNEQTSPPDHAVMQPSRGGTT